MANKNGCCGGFESNEMSAERTANQVSLGLDNCGNKNNFKAKVGEEFKWGTPVKLDGETVVPTLDGSDSIGISLSEMTAEDGDVVLVQRTGRFDWADVALAIGKDPKSMAEWAEFYKVFNKDALFVEAKL